MWYDPSDLTTMFEDWTGSVAVHKPGNGFADSPVGLLIDKSKGGQPSTELVVNGNNENGVATAPNDTLNNLTKTRSSDYAYQSTYSTKLTSDALTVNHYWNLYTVPANVSVQLTGWAYLPTGSTAGQSLKVLDLADGSLDKVLVSTFDQWVYFSIIRPAKATSWPMSIGNNLSANWNGASIYIDNLSIKQLPGNHASQSTSTARPTLSAKYNQLTYTEQFDNATWVKSISTITANNTTDPLGGNTADKFAASSSGISSYIYQAYSPAIASGSNCTYSIYAKAGDIGYFTLGLHGQPDVFFDIAGLTYRNAATPGSGFVSASIVSVGNGWVKASATWTKDAGTVYNVYTQLCSSLSSFSVVSGNYIYIWGADLRVSNDGVGLPTYQRVVDANTYDSVGFPYYLKFDGVDDALATASINFTATDEVTFNSAMRKLSANLSTTIYAELSADLASNNGSWAVGAPISTSNYSTFAKGTVSSNALTISATYSSPVSNVCSFAAKISADTNTLRLNGAQINQSTGDLGSGNFGNYPLFIGARNGATYPWAGRTYGFIVRSVLSTANQLSNTEAWLNGVAKIY